ncbi:MAG: 50S ribosomal protein L9, partial [Actinobacteria bacterium]|nr:50S ribosomal protein L9 [Actinomycetota bacterium]
MKLILTQQVAGLGEPGDVVEVKDGYGRNYLVPNRLATAWTKGGEKQVEQIRRARSARDVRDLDAALEIKSALENGKVRLAVRAGENGR